MIKVNKIENVYPAIDELIQVLSKKNDEEIVNILTHRMYKVSWTSGSELLEELKSVLKKYLDKKGKDLGKDLNDQMRDIIRVIEHWEVGNPGT